MIDPIILWVGGIVILLACVLFCLLIAELFKQQKPYKKHTTQVAKHWHTRKDSDPRIYFLSVFLGVLNNSVAQALIRSGTPALQAYLQASLAIALPVTLIVLWLMWRQQQARPTPPPPRRPSPHPYKPKPFNPPPFQPSAELEYVEVTPPPPAAPKYVDSRPSISPQLKQELDSLQPQYVLAKTETRLLRLLNGDRAGAVRLIGSIRARNPDKSEQWCWEKAVFDLERDRC